jgi:tetratricopeptide (TPR) repeat protein
VAVSASNPSISRPEVGRDFSNLKGWALRAAVIFAAAMFVYIPAMQSRWIWDDNLLITQYPPMHHPDGLRIFWISALVCKQAPWLEAHAPWVVQWFPWIKTDAALADMVPDYYPITWSTLWLEWKCWGDNPPPYHAANCLMHALAAVLVWLVLRKLSIPGAFLGGLIFAVHPVAVCSVAWVSERKNTLSIIFFLLTFLCYFNFQNARRWRWYVLSLAMFLAALLSKASMVTLPVVLLLAGWWRREQGQLRARDFLDRLIDPRAVGGFFRPLAADLVRTAPFFLLAALASWLAVSLQIAHVIRGEDVYKPGEGTWGWRLALAGTAPWFYLYKDLVPTTLLMIYNRWNIHAGSLWWYLPGVALVASATVLLCLHRRAWARHLIFGLGYFLLMLFPVLGFFDMYFYVHSLVADHWQYLAMIGVIALVVGGGTWFFQRRKPLVRWVGVCLAVAVVCILGVMTWNQTLVYHDQLTLWEYNLPYFEGAWMGQYNLGTTLAETVMNEPNETHRYAVLKQALAHLRKAVELRPTDGAAQNNTGLVLLNLGRADEAIPYLHRSLEVSKNHFQPQAAMNLGLAYRQKGDLSNAIKWLEEAHRMNLQASPDFYIVYAETLAMAGRREEALAKLTQAIQLSPNYFETYYRRGMLLRTLGKTPDALADFQQSLRLQPDAAVPSMVQIAIIDQEQGRHDEALSWLTRAVTLWPAYTEARYHLGLLLLMGGNPASAVTHLTLAAQAEPSNSIAHGNLALALARTGQIAPAIAEYRKTVELNPQWPAPMCDLAKLLARPESGPSRDPAEALQLAQKACQMTHNGDWPTLDALAMVHSEAGRFDEAVKTEQQALEAARGKTDEKTLSALQRRIDLYKSHRPYSAVEPPP